MDKTAKQVHTIDYRGENYLLCFRVTNADGRASNFLSWEQFQPGTYKMHFSTGQYFKERATETFYPYAEVG